MYDCPGCGAGLRFDIKSQKLKCDYCDSLYDPYSVTKEKDAEDGELYGMNVFTCPQCGGEVITTDESITGFCSFCGASTVLDKRMMNGKRPEKIITFKKTKEDCKEIYRKMAGKAIFAPKELKDPKYLENFRGIYIPYWSYDVDYDGDIILEGEITEEHVKYTEIKSYDVSFLLQAGYRGILYDASSGFDDRISEVIAPFIWENSQEFTPSFLCGFYADTADVSDSVYRDEALDSAAGCITAGLSGKSGISRYDFKDVKGKIRSEENGDKLDCKSHMMLCPVWFLSYRTKSDRMAYAVVNGENGNVQADLPVDVKKYVIGSLIAAVPVFFLLNFLFTLTPVATVNIGIAFSIITLILYFAENSMIKKRHLRYADKGFNEKGGFGDEKGDLKEMHTFRGCIGSLIGLGVLIVIDVINPVDDIVWYIGAIVAAILIFITVAAIIRRFNIMSTRQKPEFLNRKGGDDSAKDY